MAPLQSFELPSRRFDYIHVDLVGPLPPSRGYTYLITIVDRFTRWPEAIPIKEATTKDCARALIAGWISRFGVPTKITSDRGRQFISQLWLELNQFWAVIRSARQVFTHKLMAWLKGCIAS